MFSSKLIYSSCCHYIALNMKYCAQNSNMADEMAAKSSVNVRSLSCELGLLNKTDGSALFSHGRYIMARSHKH
jgi:hypothetical protein